jgi:hypothetical protein
MLQSSHYSIPSINSIEEKKGFNSKQEAKNVKILAVENNSSTENK